MRDSDLCFSMLMVTCDNIFIISFTPPLIYMKVVYWPFLLYECIILIINTLIHCVLQPNMSSENTSLLSGDNPHYDGHNRDIPMSDLTSRHGKEKKKDRKKKKDHGNNNDDSSDDEDGPLLAPNDDASINRGPSVGIPIDHQHDGRNDNEVRCLSVYQALFFDALRPYRSHALSPCSCHAFVGLDSRQVKV